MSFPENEDSATIRARPDGVIPSERKSGIGRAGVSVGISHDYNAKTSRDDIPGVRKVELK